jgi:ABC-type uncharacterized transport system permease subunit
MPTPLCAASLYAISAALYLAFLAGGRVRIAAVARAVLLAALVAHAVDIAVHCVHGAHPGSSAREAVSFSAFLIAAAYLYVSFRAGTAAVGGLVAPAVLMLVIAARVTPAGGRHPVVGALGRAHVSLAMVGVALFALAALASVFYLVQVRQLKRKSFGLLFHRGPPLELLDRVVQICVAVGFPVFTVAMVLGALWMARIGQAFFSPRHTLAMVTWAAFGALLLFRAVAGWHGRRSAVFAIIGFVSSLAVVLLYLMRAALGT